jgi:hypothetical protein
MLMRGFLRKKVIGKRLERQQGPCRWMTPEFGRLTALISYFDSVNAMIVKGSSLRAGFFGWPGRMEARAPRESGHQAFSGGAAFTRPWAIAATKAA